MSQQLQTERKVEIESVTPIQLQQIEILDLTQSRLERSQSPDLQLETPVKDTDWDANVDIIFATLELADLKVGRSWLDIKHFHAPGDRHKPYYSTSITNRSTEKIQIDRFGTYTRKGNALLLHSITGGYFSHQQFQAWYDVGESEWIEPGQVITDPNNHSNVGLYWAYFGTTASGGHFVAGARWSGGKSWWQLW